MLSLSGSLSSSIKPRYSNALIGQVFHGEEWCCQSVIVSLLECFRIEGTLQ